jgi:hydroxymethylpyrimidine/phosphomethylpyrimidine kinase
MAVMNRMISRPVALSIAGSDPSGGAGLQADLKTFAALGVYGLSALTLITAQDSAHVYSWIALAPALVAAQIRAAVRQARPSAVKIGTLGEAAIVAAVVDVLSELELDNIVVDPVMVSSSGTRLLSEEGEDLMRSRLLPAAAVVTPNLAEAAALSGIAVTGESAMREAARIIHGLGARAVVIKGGHLAGESPALDLFYDGHVFESLQAPRQPGVNPHGTGCAFAAAIAAWLARGESPLSAVRNAKRFVTNAIAHSFVLGHGRPLLDHLRAGTEEPQAANR